MNILAIETSCDETALALIETRSNSESFEYRIIQSLVHSQAELHSAYGGVFPSLAKREHSKNLVPLLHKILFENGNSVVPSVDSKIISDNEFAEKISTFDKEITGQNTDLIASLKDASFLKTIPNIDLIAVTEGPGLEPALWVGINFAKILGILWNVPVIPIDHMEGHVVGSLIDSDKAYGAWQTLKKLPLPSLALLISGGHTELVSVEAYPCLPAGRLRGLPSYSIIGQTKDDAAGEAFDKVARLLELPYPGGPHISKLADEARGSGIISTVKLPRPMLKTADLDFSFSGLKTAVLYAIKNTKDNSGNENNAETAITDKFKTGLAREFEDAVTEVLTTKVSKALEKTDAKSLIIGGGVSANTNIRNALSDICTKYQIPIFMPSRHISGDNALMIAIAAAIHLDHNNDSDSPKSLNNTNIKAQGTKRLM